MVAAKEGLRTRAEDKKLLPQLHGLVHPTSAITQVRCLRRADVDAQALFPKAESIHIVYKVSVIQEVFFRAFR